MFNVGVELEFVRDLVLLADVMVVADNLAARRVEGRPVGILREGEGVESGGDVTNCLDQQPVATDLLFLIWPMLQHQ